MKKTHYRTLWLSDIHLGNRDCKAEYLLSFLNSVTVDTLYLVGDIVDMWQMTKQFRWPQAHNQVMHKLMAMSQDGTRVVYLPGNHDEPIQSYSGMAFGDIEIERQLVHTTAQGKRYLVLHGDQFDGDVTMGKFHAWIGDKGYDLLLFLNREFNRVRSWRKREYWSLAGYIKKHIKGANEAIARYRQACCSRAAEMGLDGVICGHIHHPESTMENGIHYINDGDWMENCSALGEDESGNLTLIYSLETMNNADNVTPLKVKTSPSKAA
ncbi:3-diacylglucosamine pyrophosphatase LpxH [Alteromonas sp. 76-1]|uniref:UDP-2,3-diacylglucosamine diphosphatase n=1 Tax=Alteromonas sp. 76-1 TaxID=2358187 RepID=UPI000FD16FB6|nr:UDP-2,3-diacylglucosamine diphosphatase [Alteromonas sp. 76-1]VEL97789.1 3-diacylglucosamine pyrophosphatase LpxH [Alteromonas sp. 76-1]